VSCVATQDATILVNGDDKLLEPAECLWGDCPNSLTIMGKLPYGGSGPNLRSYPDLGDINNSRFIEPRADVKARLHATRARSDH
jgi:hypothetical protein